METISQAFATFFLNSIWQIALVTLAAAICARLLRDMSARYRYMLWTAALSLSLFLPVLTVSQLSSIDLSIGALPQAAPVAREIPENVPITSPSPAERPLPSATTIAIGPNVVTGSIGIYLFLLILAAAKLSRAYLTTRAIAAGAREFVLPGPFAIALERCKDVLGVSEVRVLCSGSIPVPVTIGYIKPVIILPDTMLSETDANILITALGHEMVHIKRRDYVFNLLFSIICIPISFHPAAFYLKRRIAQARELCCDELVAEKLLNAGVYARSLVTIAGSAANARMVPATTVGITDAGNLEIRIMSLLKRSEINSYKRVIMITSAVLLLAIPCVVAAYFAPEVSIIDPPATALEINAEPTPPAVDEAAVDESRVIEAKRERLKTALKEVQDSDLDPAEKELRTVKIKQELGALLESAERLNAGAGEEDRRVLEEKLKELRAAGVGLDDRKLEIEKLKREFETTAAAADTDDKKARLDELKMKLAATEERLGAAKEDLLKRDFDMAQKMEMERLSREATFRMDAAARIALGQRPGKVTENGIERSKEGEVVYKFIIRGDDGSNSVVIVSGMDGRIVKNQKIR